MSGERGERSIRVLDGVMATTALVTLTTLLLRHGYLLWAHYDRALAILNAVTVLGFVASQAAKLVVVPHPRAYLRSHRLDFILLFVLVIQMAAYAGLHSTSEFRWLKRHGVPSPLWPLMVASIQVYMIAIVALRSTWVQRLFVRLRLHPVQILVVSFALLITVGTALLAMPGAAADGRPAAIVDALFTATSAVCVTGLVVWDTGTHFSDLGTVVLLVLFQVGGLGMLTVTGSFALFGGERMARQEADTLARAMQVESAAAMKVVLRRILVATAGFEAIGALLLFLAWGREIPDTLQRSGWAIFHAVSAFCNAGFSLFPSHASLTGSAGTTAVLAIVGSLIVVGGLGFGVLDEFVKRGITRVLRQPVRALSAHARWVLVASAFLIAAGTLLFWVGERHGAFGAVRGVEAWTHAAFQSVTLRTAGFNTVDLAGLGLPTVAFCVIWMLVGGMPGGTAGGMKATTAAVALAGLLRVKGIPSTLWRRALLIAAVFLGQFVLVAGALALAQGALDRNLAFEAASALGTVGLSMGATGELGTAGKVVLCVAMFAGRVGPFALAASLLPRLEPSGGRSIAPGGIQVG